MTRHREGPGCVAAEGEEAESRGEGVFLAGALCPWESDPSLAWDGSVALDSIRSPLTKGKGLGVKGQVLND